MEKLKVVTLCSGYDSQCLALDRLKRQYPEFDYDLIAWSEIEPAAITAHDALFPQWKDRNLGDMTKIDWSTVPDFDLLFYSTPCQSISQAGLQKGFTKGSGTRSSIIWYVHDAVVAKHPRYMVLENVAAMVSQKFLPMFNLWRKTLMDEGYHNFAQVLNAADYGVPQHRERIFLVSIRSEKNEKQIPNFFFPEPFALKKKLADVLEDKVDERYYLPDARIAGLLSSTQKEKDAGRGYKFQTKPKTAKTAFSVTGNCGGRKTDNFIEEDNHQSE